MFSSPKALSVALLTLMSATSLPGCDAAPAEDSGAPDATHDADVARDGDIGDDAAPTGDGDVDAEGDAEPDIERDLSRCGDGDEACGACHGGLESGGPPPDTQGRTDHGLLTVGAHATHFEGGVRSAPVACTECHRVPANVLDRDHCDSPMPAEIRFGEIATTGGMYPMWDRAEGLCRMVYCHGATLEGGLSTTLPWTTGGPISCGSCHSEMYHGYLDCDGLDCHGNVWAAGMIIAPELHINGRLDH